MDAREKIKKKFNQKVAHALKRETALGLLTLPYNGGLFKVTRDLISFAELMSLRQQIATQSDLEANPTVVLDSFNNPILIEDPIDFTTKLWQRYYEVTNEYYAELGRIRQIRKTDQI